MNPLQGKISTGLHQNTFYLTLFSYPVPKAKHSHNNMHSCSL